ncbi:MAG TPA: hypothetical protein VGW12_21600 [Pyrinomonadaceae bacterium]|nr:hypothetical protein [Pyrinomonadaceae bacterium]
MAGILDSILNLLAQPKKRPEVSVGDLECLTEKTAYILFAVAEAVLGENFLVKAPRFIETVDDYLNYQRRAQREQFLNALLIAETSAFNLVVGGKFRGFSHMTIEERRRILEKLRASDRELRRNIYAAFVNVSASTYYASELTWADLSYAGVSVDHPQILSNPPPVPWRPADPRPVEPNVPV